MTCSKNGRRFVAACYFATTRKTAGAIRKKYLHDSREIALNGADGFCFFVNQRLTMDQENSLSEQLPDSDVDIFSLDRIRHLLHTPLGSIARLEYLGIELTKEEQLSFLNATKLDVSTQLDRIERSQESILAAILRASSSSLSQTVKLGEELSSQLSSMLWKPSAYTRAPETPPTCLIDVPLLCMLHRSILMGTSVIDSSLGVLRQVFVVVKSRRTSDRFDPPPPEDVPGLLHQWLSDWREGYESLKIAPRDAKIERIARFYYGLLEIHPFLDGNGRIALAVLDQAGLELLGTGASPRIRAEAAAHNSALRAANHGDLDPLTKLVRKAFSQTDAVVGPDNDGGTSMTRELH